MITLSYKYQNHSATLEVKGLPDLSHNSPDDAIGILSSWNLQLIGHPLLEGKKEHLDCLMSTVLQYSRHYISNSKREFISDKQTVSITPSDNMHKLFLRSSQEGIEPIQLLLDDSQLCDLTRCLDQVRLDKKVDVNFINIIYKPFLVDNNFNINVIRDKLLYPTIGTMIFCLFSIGFIYIGGNTGIINIQTDQFRESEINKINTYK